MRFVLGFTSVIMAVLAGPLQAQDEQTIITGVVRDAQGQPIAGAEIFAGRSDQPVTSNQQGQFRIAPAPSGALWVMARKIGYAPVRRSVRIAKGENQVVDFSMEALPVTLPELKVVEKSGFKSRRLEDFWRRSRGSYAGRFITREDIERRNPIQLSNMVRQYLPFAALAHWQQSPWDYQNDFAFQPSVGFGRQSRCAPAVSINGGSPIGGWLVDDIPVSEVEAVEIYRPGWTQLPIEYSHYPRANRCGLVVIWQR